MPDVGDLFETFRVPLYRFAYLLSGSAEDADDLVQEAFARYASTERREVEKPDAYLRRAITNLFLDRSRRDGAWTRRLPRMTWRPDLPDVADQAAARDYVQRELARLTERARAAVVMRYYLDLSFEDIGLNLNCPPATARSLVARALKRLRVTSTQREVR